MNIKRKHDLQEQVMVYNVMGDQRYRRNDLVTDRKLCAFWMREARKLPDAKLVELARVMRA